MEYLDQNPWAFEHSLTDDYTTLKIWLFKLIWNEK